MEEKRELVYEVAEWSHGAPELLQSWSRQEILQILCAEMGKERKYTGLTKLKIIEHLLKIVSEKRSHVDENDDDIMMNLESSASGHQRAAKRNRKSDQPNRLNVASMDDSLINVIDVDLAENDVKFCKNSACRAKLSQDGAFCKRCSCCICHQYDDNKDPSLWLICSSDPPFQGTSCGMSCHLECALRHEKSGILKDRENRGLDGSFLCVSCGKVNDLLGCWRKQMTIARDTRRVDILCYRVSLSQKLLKGTLRYQKLHEIVNETMEKLEADVGPLTGLPVKRARGIVNRLSSGQEIQRLCGFAVESLDSVLSNTSFSDPSILTPVVRFENVCPTSISVILGSGDRSFIDNVKVHRYIMWHRKTEDTDYPAKPTCTLFAPNSTKFLLSGLIPATRYVLKVVHFESTRELGSSETQFQTTDNEKIPTNQSPATNSSSLSNPSSVEDENNNILAYKNTNGNQKDKAAISSADLEKVAITSDTVNIIKNCSRNEEDNGTKNGKDFGPLAPTIAAKLPITPCKTESIKDAILARKTRPKSSQKNLDNGSEEEPDEQQQQQQQQQDGSSSKKRSEEETDDRDFGYYVKVIRWLECEGHIDTGFRKKFLTWYSLRASLQEVRIVKVFVDTLMEDPASLAGQLVDTFSDVITSKRCSSAPGLCLKLFH
ncbi:VIN3-like protein 2 isoform X2 [Cynara cardunculus var. scolymus]|nr:VIN3-like protein 2 isoform X2 [Cynara cardunculus var. scolymus]